MTTQLLTEIQVKSIHEKRIWFYAIFGSLSLTAYLIYATFLSDYNWALGLAGFELVGLFTLNYLYLPIQNPILRKLHIATNHEELSFRQAFQRQGKWLILSGILGLVSFITLLPFLTTIEASLFFILFSTVERLIQVPLATVIFKDKILNPSYYYLGMIISIIATICFKFIGTEDIDSNLFLLIIALIHTIAVVINALIVRGITTEALAKEDYVPVKVVAMIKSYFKVVGALLIGVFLYQHSLEKTLIPSTGNILGILLLGIFITIVTVLSSRLVNELSQPVARAADGIRPIVGLFAAIIFAFFSGQVGADFFQLWGWKIICVLFIAFGIWVSFKYGSPQIPDYAKPKT